MYSARGRHAFTLLEVVLSVGIIALITFSIYRFVEGTLSAIRISTEHSSQEVSLQGLSAMLRFQMNSLPPGKAGALFGEPHKFNNTASDEIQWICKAGNGLLTKNAVGEYKVSLILRPIENTKALELGLSRVLLEGNSKETNWYPLLQDISAIEFRYFDPRLNAWLEKWTELHVRPALVRMRIWRSNNSVPYEVIITLPRTNVSV